MFKLNHAINEYLMRFNFDASTAKLFISLNRMPNKSHVAYNNMQLNKVKSEYIYLRIVFERSL